MGRWICLCPKPNMFSFPVIRADFVSMYKSVSFPLISIKGGEGEGI
jgi:hypothetical protein